MKEFYTTPDLQVVYFASMQRIALEIGTGGENPPTSGGDEGDLGWEIP